MHSDALDRVYGVLAETLGRVGEDKAPLFLATLVLDLIAERADAAEALDAIARAERLTRV